MAGAAGPGEPPTAAVLCGVSMGSGGRGIPKLHAERAKLRATRERACRWHGPEQMCEQGSGKGPGVAHHSCTAVATAAGTSPPDGGVPAATPLRLPTAAPVPSRSGALAPAAAAAATAWPMAARHVSSSCAPLVAAAAAACCACARQAGHSTAQHSVRARRAWQEGCAGGLRQQDHWSAIKLGFPLAAARLNACDTCPIKLV